MPESPEPTLSVILAVYNGERFLRKAIDSVLRQTYRDFELIVIDDASTDSTASILDDYDDPRLILIHNPMNLGQTKSLNKGIKVARGHLIARQDADDISKPNRFQQQVSFLQSHPSSGLVGTSYEVIDQTGRILETVILPSGNDEIQKRLREGNLFCHGSVIIRSKVLEEVGGYREAFPVTQDYDLWLRVAEIAELANLREPLYQFRFGGQTVSRKKRGLQLAYRSLAQKLARQRRTEGQERDIPANVYAAFPPNTMDLFEEARGAAYLYFASGQCEMACRSIHQAVEILPDTALSIEEWHSWLLSKALKLAEVRADIPLGAEFIALGISPMTERGGGDRRLRETLGEYYADQAFSAYQKEARKEILPLAIKAVQHDPTWLFNRGLWSIALKSKLFTYTN
jgi:glycosyltransferase involved in cell wall biosynthesis